ncbi:MAG: hypothetical protein ACK41E_06510 [Deinococcales bacterium]
MKAILSGLVFVAVLAVVLFFTWNLYFSFFGNSVTVGSLVLLLMIPFALGWLLGFITGLRRAKPKVQK